MVEASLKYDKDPQLLLDIISAIPKRVDNTLTLHRNKLLGNVPKSRDEFDPSSLLSKMAGGDKILVLDSKKDLPANWRDIDLQERYGVQGGEGQVDTQSSGASDGTGTGTGSEDDDQAAHEASDSDSDINQINLDATVQAEPGKEPRRVLVFTTAMLLGLLTMGRWGSVDGTFKSCTKHWKQLFVMLLNFNGVWLPVAFGWLPDKTLISYQLFLILVLEGFQANKAEIQRIYGRSKLKLRKIKMDFELNISRAFEVLFKIKGCHFHFSQACKLIICGWLSSA